MSEGQAVSLLDSRPCRLGEGPSYEKETNSLFWFDILDRKLLEHRFDEALTVVHDLPFMASAIFSIDSHRQLVLAENGLHVRDRATGALSLHTPVESENNITRSNDARAHPCGAIWFGTMGLDEENGAGAIYHFYQGNLRTLFPNITIPNSICFSPDGALAYFTDTPTQRLMRVEVDPLTALPLAQPSLFFENKGDGWLDGSVCDADGNVWNARWGAGALVCHAGDGSVVRTLKIGESPQTSCPAFIGPYHDKFAVTSAYKLLSPEKLSASPDAGKTFRLDYPVRGRAEPKVII